MANLVLLEALPYNARSVLIDMIDNHGSGTTIGMRSVEFILSSSVVTVTSTTTTYAPNGAYTTDEARGLYRTGLSKTGGAYSTNSWSHGVTGLVRASCSFPADQDFDGITINNYHASGSDTDKGVNNIKIYTSPNVESVDGDSYNVVDGDMSLIYDGVLAEHAASDAADDEILVLSNPKYIDVSSESTIGTMGMVVHFALSLDDVESDTEITEFVLPNHADIDMELPVLTIAIEGTLTKNEFEIELPALSFLCDAGGKINVTLPELSLSCEGDNSIQADISCTLPSLLMTSQSGANCVAILPTLSMEAGASHEDVIVALTGDMSFSIPMLRARIIGGPDDALDIDLPMLSMVMTAQQSGDNDISFSLPALLIGMESGLISSDELRYVRGDIR